MGTHVSPTYYTWETSETSKFVDGMSFMNWVLSWDHINTILLKGNLFWCGLNLPIRNYLRDDFVDDITKANGLKLL
jgi:hypothetical protein